MATRKTQRTRGALFLTAALLLASAVSAQGPMSPTPGIQEPPPPPLKPQKPPEQSGNYQAIVEDSDVPWELPAELLETLHEKADVYSAYTRRFTCTEIARLAEYDASGKIDGEENRTYGYLLVQSAAEEGPREFRQKMGKDGMPKSGEVNDSEPFPPAYAWVFLFSRFNEPYFSFRSLGDHFEGFDWVYEIEFRGSMPFTDGKDIRQWEGVAYVDAVTLTPIEIHAEPQGQAERIEALYRRWAQSFNFMGLRSAPRPFGYRARVEFRLRREGLTFPTRLRYDTFRAVSIHQVVPAKASTRSYDDYRIFRVQDQQRVGDTIDP